MNRIILPLDNVPIQKTIDIIGETYSQVWGYKVRRQIFDDGLNFVNKIKRFYNTNVMVDFKFYEIPSGTEESLELVGESGADIITVHCTPEFVPVDAKWNSKLAGVTILTTFDLKKFKRYYKGEDITETVIEMATFADRVNYGYVVCSAVEVKHLNHLKIKKICPAIRPTWYYGEDDQKRIATPKNAVINGADLLVIGRPILNSENMLEAIERTNEEIESV